MMIFNINVKRGADGSKHLDVQLHGVIDGGWLDDETASSSDLAAKLAEHADAKTVGVRINSVGGSLFGGVAMYNALAAHPGEVTCYVQGLAASAATLPAMAGKTVMGRGSMMMVHSPSTVVMGNAVELRKTADVLDKAQEALASIYEKKTGKGRDEINSLLDDETWMTAEEAVAAGFADLIGDAPAETEPAPSEPPEARGESVIWNGVAFPRSSLPPQLLAMAKVPAAAVPAPAALTRELLAAQAPDLLASLRAEGHAAGVAAERARLQAIDDLGVKGCPDLVAAAKYGERPSDAPALAVAVVKLGQHAGAELLANRRSESGPAARVGAVSPDHDARAEEARLVKAISDGGNARRGGGVR